MSQICRVVEEAKYTAREKRINRTKPQPWIVLKLMVFITFGIMVYAGYVYIGRFCVYIIRGNRPGVDRGSGIALLAVFCVLYLWMLWSYFMVVITPPGFARDCTSQEQPPNPLPPPPLPISYAPEFERGTNDRDSIGGPSYEEMRLSSSHSAELDHEAGVMNAIPVSTTTDIIPNTVSSGGSLPTHQTSTRQGGSVLSKSADRDKKLLERDLQRAASRNVARRPPTIPILLPQHRYCSRCLFVKPFRAHHCRACGTCVLKYDHHCPWIGQCVGARNHKFFLNFNFATSLFTVYTFSTLLAYTVRLSHQFPQADLDIQELVIIALAGLFFIFTTALFTSHIRLICLSQTTVESMQSHTMREREDHALADVFSFWEISNKRRVQRAWDREWGRIDREGNIWWLGSARRGWEDTMGSARRSKENPWGWVSWVFPLVLKKNMEEVGLKYEVNPRFDEEGRWRRRSEWPSELREKV